MMGANAFVGPLLEVVLHLLPFRTPTEIITIKFGNDTKKANVLICKQTQCETSVCKGIISRHLQQF